MTYALTVRQPWSSAFFRRPVPLAKTVENRTWATSYRGRIAIHASLVVDREGLKQIGSEGFEHDQDRGVILGTVELVDVHKAWSDGCRTWGCEDSPWAQWPTAAAPRVMHWMVEHPRQFVTPIRARGALQLWTPGPSALHLMSIAEVVP